MTREGDLISRQAVIDACEQSINILEAVDRIMNLPSVEQEPSEDAISRQATIEAFQMFRGYEANRTNAEWVDRIETVVEKLPSVNPLEAVEQDKSKNNVLEQLKNLIDEFNMQDLSFDEMSGFECKVLELLEQNYSLSRNPQEPKTDTWSIKDVADTLAKYGLTAEQEPCDTCNCHCSWSELSSPAVSCTTL